MTVTIAPRAAAYEMPTRPAPEPSSRMRRGQVEERGRREVQVEERREIEEGQSWKERP